MEMGIEADLIMMHHMTAGIFLYEIARRRFVLKYVIAKLSAFCNIWCALANEYDLMPRRQRPDWERMHDSM